MGPLLIFNFLSTVLFFVSKRQKLNEMVLRMRTIRFRNMRFMQRRLHSTLYIVSKFHCCIINTFGVISFYPHTGATYLSGAYDTLITIQFPSECLVLVPKLLKLNKMTLRMRTTASVNFINLA